MIAAGVTENQGLDNLALFVLGVVAARDNGFSNTNGGTGFSVNGLRGRNNDQQIDGQNNNDISIANLALFKNIKMNERASLEFNATLQNVVNHPDFQSVDPNIENVGLSKSQQAPFVGFADPSVTNDVVGNALGNRIVRVGLTFRF